MNVDILITNVRLLPFPGRETLAGSSFIALSGERISHMGPMGKEQELQAEMTIDGTGCLAMPGLVNGHCHCAMTLFRGLADDLKLHQWLQEHIFPAEAAHVSREMVYWCSKLAAAEMLLSGTTMVADGYFHEHEAARAFADAGIRAVAAQGVIDFPAPGVPDPADNIHAAEKFIGQWQGHPLIQPAVFAHSPHTCSNTTLRAAKKLADKTDATLFIHVAETAQEQTMIQKPLAETPVQHLEALGLLDEKTVCIHCVTLDEKDMAVLAKRQAGVVTCPQSNCKLASGVAPITEMVQRRIKLALGTDGCASNNSLDLFREMDICAKIQKVQRMDPVAVPAADILQMASTGGAGILGFGDKLGWLTVGNIADLILVDLNQPHLHPFHGPDLLVYAASGADVKTTIVHGRPVMIDRTLLSMDIDEVMTRVRELALRVIK